MGDAVDRGPEQLRARMVDALVREGAITSEDVEAAFRVVPRHLFLPGADPGVVYGGGVIPIRDGADGVPLSASSEPALMATMLGQLGVTWGDSIMEIGTGSGYNAGLLATLAGERGRVTTIDLEGDLVEEASRHLRRVGLSNVEALAGDGWAGAARNAPYDRIEVTAGIWDISPMWVDQLAPDGILVVPLWLRAGVQASVAFRREGQGLVSLDVVPCGFLRLRGPHAGPEVFVVMEEWVVCLDEDAPSRHEAVARLLESVPDISPSPELPDEWFTEVALSHPAPVRMWTTTEPWIDRQGILLTDGDGLALVESGSIHTFGHARARDELLEVASASGRTLEQLTMRAQPTGEGAAEDAALVRPAFSYFLVWP